MSWPGRFALFVLAYVILHSLAAVRSNAQWFSGNLRDSTIRADYLIVAPQSYVSTVQPLAAYRTSRQSYVVMITLLDSIAAQFPRASVDSSMRDFVTTALTQWRSPKPRFLLLAGNVNAVPTHMARSRFSASFGEDSVAVDQWFVNQLTESQLYARPEVAIGRFPAWTKDELVTMVNKTLAYEDAPTGPWAMRSLVAADSGDGGIFESDAASFQRAIAARWPDTVTVHVRPASPAYESPGEFLRLWNVGSAFVNLIGHINSVRFSSGSYFTLQDVESLSVGTPPAICLLSGGQGFAQRPGVPMAVALLQRSGCGAVVCIAPTGLMFEMTNSDFCDLFTKYLCSHPGEPVGIAWLDAAQRVMDTINDRRVLLGDPALVVKSGTIASTADPGDSHPGTFALLRNYPNPFNPTTTIEYSVAGVSTVSVASGSLSSSSASGTRGAVWVEIAVYDVMGREVARLVDESKVPGSYKVRFDGSKLASGVYVCRMLAGSLVSGLKMMLMR